MNFDLESKVNSLDFIEKFWSHVKPSSDKDCWPWMRSYNKGGYGVTGFFRHTLTSHRVAFRITYGFWPKFACHTCDNPPCCNPSHIVNGTPKWNTRDALYKGRWNPPHGERCAQSKLVADQVLEIRRLYASGGITMDALGEKFKITSSGVSNILTRKNWKHI